MGFQLSGGVGVLRRLGGRGVFSCAHALRVRPVGPSCPSPGQPWPSSGGAIQAQLGIQMVRPRGRKEGEGVAQRGPGRGQVTPRTPFSPLLGLPPPLLPLPVSSRSPFQLLGAPEVSRAVVWAGQEPTSWGLGLGVHPRPGPALLFSALLLWHIAVILCFFKKEMGNSGSSAVPCCWTVFLLGQRALGQERNRWV